MLAGMSAAVATLSAGANETSGSSVVDASDSENALAPACHCAMFSQVSGDTLCRSVGFVSHRKGKPLVPSS